MRTHLFSKIHKWYDKNKPFGYHNNAHEVCVCVCVCVLCEGTGEHFFIDLKEAWLDFWMF